MIALNQQAGTLVCSSGAVPALQPSRHLGGFQLPLDDFPAARRPRRVRSQPPATPGGREQRVMQRFGVEPLNILPPAEQQISG